MSKITNCNYDDTDMRIALIRALPEITGYRFKSGTRTGIDLVCCDEPEWGVEGERGSWDGDRWTNIKQYDIFGLGVKTINIQQRKWHYWNLNDLTDKTPFWNGKFDEGWDRNMYARINKQYDQICIVKAETILNSEKRIIVYNKKVSNSFQPEDWICIPEEYVETYNKQKNGVWVLSTEPNGNYIGLTYDEILREKEKKRIERVKQLKSVHQIP